MKDFFQKLEERLLSEEVRKSRESLDTLLDRMFLEYGSSGKQYKKDTVLERLPDAKFFPIKVSDFSVFEISKDFVQTRFKTHEEDRTSLRSSIWKKYSDNDWKMIFHQGTPIPDDLNFNSFA